MSRALAGWDRFWFTRRSSTTAALVRIWGALVLLGWGATVGRDVLSFFGPEAILSPSPDYKLTGLKGIWSVLGPRPSATLVIAVYVAFMVGSLCLLVGYHTRLAAVAVFLAMVSFTRRTPVVFNSGDALLRAITFYLLLLPGGAALSLDRRRRVRKAGGDFWDSPARAVWPLRLMQIQLSVAYLAAVWAKVGGSTWRSGTAVSFALRLDFIRRLPVPEVFSRSLVVANLLTFATLATELALGLAVWNRRVRARVLLVGVVFHLVLDYAFRVGFFSYAMFVLYLAFVPPEPVDAWLARRRDRRARRRQRRGGAAGPSAGLAEQDGAAPPAGEDERPAEVAVDGADVSTGVARD